MNSHYKGTGGHNYIPDYEEEKEENGGKIQDFPLTKNTYETHSYEVKKDTSVEEIVEEYRAKFLSATDKQGEEGIQLYCSRCFNDDSFYDWLRTTLHTYRTELLEEVRVEIMEGKLGQLMQFYASNRGTGHTFATIKGVENTPNAFLLVADENQKKNTGLPREKQKRPIMKTYILRVQKLVPHEDGEHLKFQEAFIEVPAILYDAALQEKKSCKNLSIYAFLFDKAKQLLRKDYLPAHTKIIDYIQDKVGRIDGASIERINITPTKTDKQTEV